MTADILAKDFTSIVHLDTDNVIEYVGGTLRSEICYSKFNRKKSGDGVKNDDPTTYEYYMLYMRIKWKKPTIRQNDQLYLISDNKLYPLDKVVIESNILSQTTPNIIGEITRINPDPVLMIGSSIPQTYKGQVFNRDIKLFVRDGQHNSLHKYIDRADATIIFNSKCDLC